MKNAEPKRQLSRSTSMLMVLGLRLKLLQRRSTLNSLVDFDQITKVLLTYSFSQSFVFM